MEWDYTKHILTFFLYSYKVFLISIGMKFLS